MIPTPDQVDLLLYHAGCWDGFTAAWVAWLFRGDACEYVPVYHSEPPPDVTGRNVAIFDFAYKRPVLEQMAAAATSLVIVDHHKSAWADLAGLDYAVFDMNRSGARLAFDWFLGKHDSWVKLQGSSGPRVNAVERLCDCVQDRDLWRWALPNSREISEAMKILPFEFGAWSQFCQDLAFNQQGVIDTGHALLAMTKQHLQILAQTAEIARLDDHVVWVACAPYIYASELGHLLCTRSGAGVFDDRSARRDRRDRDDGAPQPAADQTGAGRGCSGYGCGRFDDGDDDCRLAAADR